MSFLVRYFRCAIWGKASKSPSSPVLVGWHDEVFASTREAVERGCELIEEGIGIITVAPLKDDPLDGWFFPLRLSHPHAADVSRRPPLLQLRATA